MGRFDRSNVVLVNEPTWQRRILGIVGLGSSAVVLAVLAVSFSNRVSEVDSLAFFAEAPASTPAPTVTTTTTTTTTSTTTTTTLPPRTATIAFTGDTLAHSGVVRQARTNGQRATAPEGADYDFAPMFDLVRPYLAGADIAICHLETPLSPDNTGLRGYPTFSVPREMAASLAAAGYDGCTTASNHSLDRRPAGVADTLDVLDEAGLLHSGMARDQREYDAATIYDASGISVASLSYSYGFNGFTEPSDTPWLVNEINIAEIAAEVSRARVAGAEYVAVSLHWGTEYRHDPNQYQQDNAKLIAAIDGVDIVIGHHAHVIQPVQMIDGVPIVFGLGNFLSNQSSICCVSGSQDGIIMQVHIHERTGGGFDTSLTYVPTRVDRQDFTIVPVVDALAKPNLAALPESELQKSRDRTAEVIYRMGNNAEVGEAGPFGATGSIGETGLPASGDEVGDTAN